MSNSVRAQSAQALAGVFQQGKSLSEQIARFVDTVPARDRGLMQELCYGVCRFAEPLRSVAKASLHKPLKPRDADIEALIYLGVYQLLYTRVPDHAAISATVQATRELNKKWAAGMVNGVLRAFQREREQWQKRWQDCPELHYSHPNWLLQRLRQAWPEHWQAIVEANNQPGPLTLRVNRRLCQREHYLTLLAEQGIAAQNTPISTDGITLQQAMDVTRLPHFHQGWVSVQDEAAQLCCDLLALAPNQRVLDACCAPGGKTGHILEREPHLMEVVALDADAARMARVHENLNRLGLQAQLQVAPAEQLTQWWQGEPFDRILLDAPCSATGVIRRHPDIKLLRRANDIAKLAQLQGQLLQTLWQTLKPGGRLVYTTCSVLPEENEEVIAYFLNCVEDAEVLPIDFDKGVALARGRQLLPQPAGHDGFFYAVLRKTTG